MTFEEWYNQHQWRGYAPGSETGIHCKNAFQAGAASRDAEVAKWQNAYEKAAEAALIMSQERDQLREHVTLLREFVSEWLDRQGTDKNYMVQKAREALAATEPMEKWK